MSPVRRKIQRLLVLFAFGCLALNYPLLSLFSKVTLWYGIPALYLYLFVFWILFILFIAIVTERKKLPRASFPPIFSRKPE
jgi:predicted permease